VGPRTGLDAMKKIKMLQWRESNPDRPARSPSTSRLLIQTLKTVMDHSNLWLTHFWGYVISRVGILRGEVSRVFNAISDMAICVPIVRASVTLLHPTANLESSSVI
jgi:hypothetical protein